MNLSALQHTSFVYLLYSLHPLNLAGCCGRMLWGFPPSDAGHRKGRMWGGFQLFLGWFPRFVFVTAACADACVAVCFAGAGAGAACFAYTAGGEVFEDWTVGYYSNFFEKDNDEEQ